MLTIVTALYIFAGILSLIGPLSPYLTARRQERRALRAKDTMASLQAEVDAAYAAQDDAQIHATTDRRDAARKAPFPGGKETLEELTEVYMFTPHNAATLARWEIQARAAGLWWIAAGICVGSIASILSLHLPPAP